MDKIKPLTSAQLCRMYGIKPRTFSRWLKPHIENIGERQGYLWNPKQVRTIFSIIGEPPENISIA